MSVYTKDLNKGCSQMLPNLISLAVRDVSKISFVFCFPLGVYCTHLLSLLPNPMGYNVA